ncbi:hypothetical protein CAPTEDRAFT_193580 [Capitella teleta]|uniref:Uncharacterized protein n=1 Tax=Capitella teleta TaxID=283909 RepID=R7VKU5_CAPTE|nr:hypothetical protein CAPTEDRAFT_193580 [Capitella teleta]|eukprot:ELU17666.1 hypothetical protein CAPTEDRAFT_193580 [Capitella teleta]
MARHLISGYPEPGSFHFLLDKQGPLLTFSMFSRRSNFGNTCEVSLKITDNKGLLANVSAQVNALEGNGTEHCCEDSGYCCPNTEHECCAMTTIDLCCSTGQACCPDVGCGFVTATCCPDGFFPPDHVCCPGGGACETDKTCCPAGCCAQGAECCDDWGCCDPGTYCCEFDCCSDETGEVVYKRGDDWLEQKLENDIPNEL